MGLFGFKKKESNLKWLELGSEEELEEFNKLSAEKPVLLFKHSTRCSISFMAKSRLEESWDIEEKDVQVVLVDLLRHRDLSHKIANQYNVMHQSPQILMIKNGECTYSATHSNISLRGIKSEL